MTRISYIHGPVPQNEVKDRAAEVKPLPYFDPLGMTEGQAYLTLMRDQVLTLAQYYPDRPIYKKGLSLINNTLYKGINSISPAIGAVEPTLYPVMNAIQKYKQKTFSAVSPAGISGIGSWKSQSMVAGIGADIIDKPKASFTLWWFLSDRDYLKTKGITDPNVLQRQYVDPFEYGTRTEKDKPWGDLYPRWLEFRKRYDKVKFVIDLYNNKIEEFAYHPIYNYLPSNSGEFPATVVAKQLYHRAGVESCAKEGYFSNENMSLWMRTGILRANIKGDAGALSPEQSIFSFTGLPDSQYQSWLNGNKIYSVNRQRNDAKVGIAFVVLIPLIVAAIAAATQIALAIINKDQVSALNSVQGWGTNAYAMSEADWKHYQELIQNEKSGGNSLPLPLLLGGGAALYLALSK